MEEKTKKLNLSTLIILLITILIILIIVIAFYFIKQNETETDSNNLVQNNNQVSNENTLLENNNSEIKNITLTNEQKIAINKELYQLVTKQVVEFHPEGNIIYTDEGKYKFINLIKLNELLDNKENILIKNEHGVGNYYMPITKFETYAKKFYGQELNINNLTKYIYTKDNVNYIKISLDGLSVRYAIKADYITENTKTKERCLYVNIINLDADENMDTDKRNQYLSTDFLDYDKSKVTEVLKLTYKINSENNKYKLTDIRYVYPTLEDQVEVLARWYVGAINNQDWDIIEKYNNSSNLYNESTISNIFKEYEITNYSITSEIEHWEPEGVESNQSVYFYYVSYDIENTEIESAKEVGLGKMLVINLTKLDSGDIEYSITPFATGI